MKHGTWRERPAANKSGDLLAALGLFLFCCGVYALSGAGRIDIIDGQYRYEVARNLLDGQGFQIDDPVLRGGIRGVDGRMYAFYGPMASLLSVPLVWVARLLGGDRNLEMYMFSFTSGLLVSIGIAAFYLFLRRLGRSAWAAFVWSLVLAFATPMWSLATTVFDQGQQAVFLMVGLALAWAAAVTRNSRLAVVAGVISGSLVLFQEGLVLLLPAIGLVFLADLIPAGQKRRPTVVLRRLVERGWPFVVGCLLPIGCWMLFNFVRFGNPLDSGKSHVPGHPPLWGNPIDGALGLLLSPGKSIFLFCPTALVSLWALRSWLRQGSTLARSIVCVCVVQLAFTSSLAFWGSDWAWGPRYLLLLSPLLTVALAIHRPSSRLERSLIWASLGIGVCVQGLGVAVEHHRFFLEHNLSSYFWYHHPELYWQQSQFFSRPAEFLSILTEPPPERVVAYRPGPYPSWPTYCIFGLPPFTSHILMRTYSIFYHLRPWPFWVPTLAPELRPVDTLVALGFCLALVVTGGLLVVYACRALSAGSPQRDAV